MSPDRPPGLAAPWPDPPVLVVGEGLVLDDGAGPRLLLGGHQQSIPPVGDGPPLRAWDWKGLTSVEHADGSTWAEAVVVGTWDGEVLSVLQSRAPIADSGAPDRGDGPPGLARPRGRVGTVRLSALQRQLHQERRGPASIGLLTSYVEPGHLALLVTYDDGSLARAFEQHLGPGAVSVSSALRPWPGPDTSEASAVTS